MATREFHGADFEPASKFLGALRHAEAGGRSYWHGASDLCAALSRSDVAFVATDATGSIAGIMALASPRTEDAAREMRAHWSGQRTVIRAVCMSLGITLSLEEDDLVEDEGLTVVLGDNASLVTLLACADTLGELDVAALRMAGLTWLTEHGVELAEAPAEDEVVLLPNGEGDYDRIAAIIDAHAAQLGHTFHQVGYHVERDGVLVAGISAWTFGADLYIDVLAVEESLRQQGIGARLIAAAEAEGRRLGCTTASVDTFSFQAPDYYPRLGYREVLRRSFSDGTERIWFTKEL